MFFLRFLFVSALLILPLAAAGDAASTLHLSTTEARLDRERGRLTLVVRVIGKDLATALKARLGREINVGDAAEVAAPAVEYIRETLRLTAPEGKLLQLQWSGIDITSTHVFLFFETPVTGRLDGTSVTDTLLHEYFPDQLNTVDFTDGLTRQTLVFAHDTGAQIIGKAR